MLSRFRSHIGGNVIGYLALFVALGGTSAYAAASIGSSDIENNAVKSKHIAEGQVKSSDALDNGLTGVDVNEATLGPVPKANQLGNQGPGAYEQRWALVAGNGTIKEQSGGITVTKGNTGLYIVDFGSSLVSQGLDITTAIANVSTFGQAARCGGGNGITCSAGDNTTSEALVSTRVSTTATPADTEFYISVNP